MVSQEILPTHYNKRLIPQQQRTSSSDSDRGKGLRADNLEPTRACAEAECAIVCGEDNLLPARFPPQLGGREMYRIESAERRNHRLSCSVQHRARKLDEIEAFEHMINRLPAMR